MAKTKWNYKLSECYIFIVLNNWRYTPYSKSLERAWSRGIVDRTKEYFFCPVHNASTPCSLQAFRIRCIVLQQYNSDINNSSIRSWYNSHVATISRKVGGQVNALNRLKNILPCRTKEALYRAFILPHFNYCSQIWHHCGARNTRKIERVNERACDMYTRTGKHHMKSRSSGSD